MKSLFLKKIIEDYPAFKFVASINRYSESSIDGGLHLDYFLTICEITGIDNVVYNILITCKKTARQQHKRDASEEFIINSLNRLMLMGF